MTDKAAGQREALDLDVLTKLLAEATPGPWVLRASNGPGDDHLEWIEGDGRGVMHSGEQCLCAEDCKDKRAVVALRNAAPELLRLARIALASPAPAETKEVLGDGKRVRWGRSADTTIWHRWIPAPVGVSGTVCGMYKGGGMFPGELPPIADGSASTVVCGVCLYDEQLHPDTAAPAVPSASDAKALRLLAEIVNAWDADPEGSIPPAVIDEARAMLSKRDGR